MSTDADPSGRGSALTLMLTTMLGFFCLFVLILMSGGFFFWVLVVALAIGAFGTLHYLMWGKALDESVAGEREEEQLRERAQADEWPMPEERGFRG
jgi:hypothetical protein